MLEGRPQVWIDGEVHDLEPGDGVGFPKGTGIAHTFLNNTGQDVRLLVVGEKSQARQQDPLPAASGAQRRDRRAPLADWPERPLGPHDGLPDRLRDKGGVDP